MKSNDTNDISKYYNKYDIIIIKDDDDNAMEVCI
jgi:hypothetical protein